jgi:4-hydroxybenzoate polyprenyltransferase
MAAWLELIRLSNTPTVLSNVLAGTAVGLLARLGGTRPEPRTLAALLGGAALVYAAGMVLNDAFDARMDAGERPSRPVPSGRVSRGAAFGAGLAMLAGGTALLSVSGEGLFPWALLLAALVLLYDALHAQMPGAWLVPGLCRALVVLISARAMSPGAPWDAIGVVAGGLVVFVALVSVVAREETRGLDAAGRVASALLPVAVLAPLGLLLLDLPPASLWSRVAGFAVLGAVAWPVTAFAAAQARRGKVGMRAAIGAWLGAIALLDATVAFLADQPWLGLACVGLWGAAGALRPRIAAT